MLFTIPRSPTKDEFPHLELLLENLDLIAHDCRIRGVARKHSHRQRFPLRIRQQAQDDLQFPLFAAAVVAELAEFILLSLQIAVGDVVLF